MPIRGSLLLAALLLASCDSKIETNTDQALLDKIDTVVDCFPGLYDKVDGLLELADSWRMNTSGSIADPAGLSYSIGGSGEIVASFTGFEDAGCTLAMTIRFYDPSGVEQNLNLTSASTLADKIDLAATTLRNASPTGNPFLVAEWNLSGTKGGDAISGSGSLTGIIGAATGGNELEELRTTIATPAGGPPAVAASTITEATCSLAFTTSSLVTDSTPTQSNPIGTIDITITRGAVVVDASVTFDGSSTIQVRIDGTSGRFDYDVATKTLTQRP